MNKTEYLSDPFAEKFIHWLSNNLDTGVTKHSYINSTQKKLWSCDSIFDAYQKYYWKFPAIPSYRINAGSTFEESKNALKVLQMSLINSIQKNQIEDVCEATKAVMAWGGVKYKNINWLENNKNSLPGILTEVKIALNGNSTDAYPINDKNLRFNSGMTKIYSLICDKFIIYDSRVAAALGLFINKFCSESSLQKVPDSLAFPHMPAKGSHCRNPSNKNFHFPILRTGSHHAIWNLKASWLLDAILTHENSRNSGFNQMGEYKLRALESALFMIGYEIAKK